MFNFLKKKKRVMTEKQFQDVGLIGPMSLSGQRVSVHSALKLPVVFACVRVISEAAAALPLIVYERGADGSKKRARNHSLYRLLHDAPNPFMDSFTVFELLLAGCLLRGNSYAQVERDHDGTIVAIYPLQSSQMMVKVENNNILYEYNQNGKKHTFKWYEILHLKGLSFDGIIGLSPLSLLSEAIGRAQAVNEYSAKFFINDASPGGIIKHPKNLGEKAHNNLMKTWYRAYGGNSKSHKTAILEEGMDFQSIGLSPEESQMIDTAKFSVVEICRAYKVPLNLVQDHERSTYSNVTEQNRSFVVHTLQPWLKRIEQVCNRVLFTEREKERFFVEYKLDSLLKGDQKTRYECYEIGMNKGFLSINDVRGFENLTPVPGGDQYQPDNEPAPARAMTRAQEEPTSRDKILENFKPLIREAAGTIINHECGLLKSGLREHQNEFKTFLENLYTNDMPDYLKEKYGPVLRSFANAIIDQAEGEMGATGSDLEEYIQEHIDHVVDGHGQNSLNQLFAILEGEDLEAVEARVDEWQADDNRVNKITEQQSNATANKIFSAVAFHHGFKVVVQASGNACKFCKSISGTVLGKGDYAIGAGTHGDMVVKKAMSAPPWHRGCTCYLTHK
jgi:HK97 family phage portal protein